MAGQNLQVVQQVKTLQEYIGKYKKAIAQALPHHIDLVKFSSEMLTTCMRHPKLLECEIKSVMGAAVQSASLGLSLNDSRGLAYLVPFWNSKRRVFEAVFIPGYKGLMHLAYNSGMVTAIQVNLVYSNEDFVYEGGLRPVLKHKPLPPNKRGEKIIAAYATAELTGGGTVFTWLWEQEILDNHRAKSSSYQAFLAGKMSKENCLWESDPVTAYKKTAIRDLAKYIPQSPDKPHRLAEAAGMDELAEQGKPMKMAFDEEDAVDFSVDPDIDDKTEGKKEGLTEKLKAENEKGEKGQGTIA